MTQKKKKKKNFIVLSHFQLQLQYFQPKNNQLAFKLFCYSNFSNKFSISAKEANLKQNLREHILELPKAIKEGTLPPINCTPSICQYVPKIMVFEWIANYQENELDQMDTRSLVPRLVEISTSPSLTLTTSVTLTNPLG